MASWCRRALRHAPAIWAEKSTGTTGPISAQILSMSQLLRWKWKSEKSIATGTHNSELPSARLSCYGPIILDGGWRRAVGSRRPMDGAPGGQHFCSGREPSGLPALWGREKAPPPVGRGLRSYFCVLTFLSPNNPGCADWFQKERAPPKRGQGVMHYSQFGAVELVPSPKESPAEGVARSKIRTLPACPTAGAGVIAI